MPKTGDKGDEATVGWHVILDSSLWCTECAPDESEARHRVGASPDDDRVRVAPVDPGWARTQRAVCRGCGRPLA